jgi:hypothetical protein
MPDKETTVTVVDFKTFYPTPEKMTDYDGKKYPAWGVGQLGEADRGRIENVLDDLKTCSSTSDQVNVVVTAIRILVPAIPVDKLRNEPFDALFSYLLYGLLGFKQRPTKAARRKKSGKSDSRRTTSK